MFGHLEFILSYWHTNVEDKQLTKLLLYLIIKNFSLSS